jgi:exosortase
VQSGSPGNAAVDWEKFCPHCPETLHCPCRDSRLGCPGPSEARPACSPDLADLRDQRYELPAQAFTVAHSSNLRLCSNRPRAEEASTLSQLVESESPVAHPPARQEVKLQPVTRQRITLQRITLRRIIGRHIKPAIPFWQAAILAALSLWLYGPTIYRLVLQWAATDSDFSHGFFVPLFSAFVLWQERRRLSEIILKPSWWGLPLLAFALCVLIVGRLGAELFLARVSMLLLIAGLVVLFAGWNFFRAVFFPWAFLLLMIPIPTLVFNQITFPLQLLASRIAADVLPLFDVPVLREGNLINLPRMLDPLFVDEACSGIRSLMSLVCLAIIYGYLMERRIVVRWALAVISVPIAVAANSARIIGTGLVVQYWDLDKAQGFYHIFAGWLVFVVCLVLLYLAHLLIQSIWPDRGVPS